MRLFFKLLLLFAVVSVLGFIGWFVYNLLSSYGNLPSGYFGSISLRLCDCGYGVNMLNSCGRGSFGV